MNSLVRQLNPEESAAASELVQMGFIRHVAPDWEASARESFLADTTAAKFEALIREASFACGYVEDGQVLGILFMPRPNLVQLLFVSPGHLRRGIARALWAAARSHLEAAHPKVTTVELNSSPYAVAAYKALGFFPISQAFRRRGAVATRMACWLPGRALERAVAWRLTPPSSGRA